MKYLGKRFIRAAAAILVWVFAVTAAAPTSVARAFDDDLAVELSGETFDIVYEWAEETAAWFSDPISLGGESEEVFEITSSVVNGDNAKTCYKFIIENMDLNSAAACGILANIALESAFKPDALGDKGTSYGICQWHDTKEGVGRWTSLKAYCDKNSLDWKTLDGQLKYLAYEADEDYPATMKAMRAVKNTAEGAWEAGRVWCKNFEVPANTETVSKQRGDVAKESFWPVYGEEDEKEPPEFIAGVDLSVLAGRKIDIVDKCFAEVKDRAERYIVKEKADKTFATVTAKGKLTAKKAGKAVIVAQIKDGKEWVSISDATVTILPKPKLALSALTWSGETLDASVCFSNDSPSLIGGADSWKSSKPSIAEIDPDTGVITAVKSGKTKITAYFGEKGKSGTVSVSANIKVKIPAFGKRSYKLKVGKKTTIAMKNVSADSEPYFYTADTNIATAEEHLDKKGEPTGKVVVVAAPELDDGPEETELFAQIDGQIYSTIIKVY